MNKKMLRLLFVWLVFCLRPYDGFSQWEQTRGPCGGSVTCICPDADNLWTGTGHGLLFTADHGATWINRSQGLPQYTQCFMRNGSKLFAGTSNNGVYISSDEGTSWVWTSINSGAVYALVKTGGYIFAGTSNGVFRSFNNGGNWVPVNSGLTNTVILAMVNKGTDLFAGCWDGVFRSADNGTTWTQASNGLPSSKIIVSMATAGNYLYAATASYGVFASNDNGVNWVSINQGLPDFYITSVCAHDSSVFVASNGKLYRSSHYGAGWQPLVNGLSTFYTEYLAISGDTVYAGSGEHGLLESDNKGDSWSATGFVETYVQCLAQRGGAILAGLFSDNENGGVFLSCDDGMNWESSNFNHGSAYAFDSSGSLTYAALFGVSVSSDSGKTWVPFTSLFVQSVVQTLAVRGNNIFIGTYGNGVYLSTNSGTSWNPANKGMEHDMVNDLAFSGNYLVAALTWGVKISSDNGNSWQDADSGMAARSVRSLTVTGDRIFAGTFNGVFVSHDNGFTWTASGLDTVEVNSIVYDKGILYAATARGVYISRNEGAAWDSASEGLTNRDIRTLLIKGDKILAGTFGAGIWQQSVSNILSGIKQTVSGGFRVFPNPAHNRFFISSANGREGETTARVINCLGQCMATVRFDWQGIHEIEVTGLPVGIYILRLECGDKRYAVKLVLF